MAVVGAGVVGSALAYSMAKSGRKVALFERDFSEPDRIVGELLQPSGVRALRQLDLQDCLEGIDAVSVQGYHVFYQDRDVPIPYPTEKPEETSLGIASTSGKVEGRSFHHGRFIQKLRSRARAQERVTCFEAAVRELLEDEHGRTVGVLASLKNAESQSSKDISVQASLTIVADGCFSKFRRTHGSSISPLVRSNFVGIELEHAPLPSPNHGHVVLGPAGPTLLYQISAEHTRVLMDIPGEKLPSVAKGDLQKYIRDRVIPQLPSVLQNSVLKEVNKGQRLRSMPNSFLPPSMQGQSKQRQGVIAVGDAMNMRHPLTGGGMSVGLWDVVHLTNTLGGRRWRPSAPTAQTKLLSDWRSLQPSLAEWHWERKKLSSVINILAQALYSLFGADDTNLEVLREGCFKYFELGGECVAGPVSLLSGLAPQPLLLVYHFFSVALYSIFAMFTHPRLDKHGQMTRPSWLDYPALCWRSVAVFYTACIVLLPVVFTELQRNVPRFPAHPGASKGHSWLPSSILGVQLQPTYLAVGLAAIMAYIYSGQAGQPGSGIREIVLPSHLS